MIADHMRILLLRPGIKVKHLGDLPAWLDDSDPRPAVVQLGARWRPLDKWFALEGSCLLTDGERHPLLGGIRLLAEMVLLFDSNFVAVVQSDKTVAAGKVDVAGVEQ